MHPTSTIIIDHAQLQPLLTSATSTIIDHAKLQQLLTVPTDNTIIKVN
jgi:hypothetical protein